MCECVRTGLHAVWWLLNGVKFLQCCVEGALKRDWLVYEIRLQQWNYMRHIGSSDGVSLQS